MLLRRPMAIPVSPLVTRRHQWLSTESTSTNRRFFLVIGVSFAFSSMTIKGLLSASVVSHTTQQYSLLHLDDILTTQPTCFDIHTLLAVYDVH